MNAQQRDGGQWITADQAAPLLGVSARTVRRRCKRGELAARLDEGEFGPVWLIDSAAISADSADTRGADKRGQRGHVSALERPNHAQNSADSADKIGADTSADSADSADKADLMAALIASKDARISDLQKQLDATNGNLQRVQDALAREQLASAETRAALAFAMSTPMLPTVPPTVATAPSAAPADANAKATRPPRKRRRRPLSVKAIGPLLAALIGYRPKD